MNWSEPNLSRVPNAGKQAKDRKRENTHQCHTREITRENKKPVPHGNVCSQCQMQENKQRVPNRGKQPTTAKRGKCVAGVKSGKMPISQLTTDLTGLASVSDWLIKQLVCPDLLENSAGVFWASLCISEIGKPRQTQLLLAIKRNSSWRMIIKS